MSSATGPSTIVIRDIECVSEIREVEKLQKEIWGCEDLDVVPLTMLIAAKEVGGILVGAYDGSSLAGFVFGFPGHEAGQLVHHSHMLAVKPSYRNLNLGYKLKLAQRDRVLARDVRRITWTFDPLQSLNAHFNFTKLGVLSDQYKINFYGEATSSFLHQVGTDRMWVTWMISSDRVIKRLQSGLSDFEAQQLPTLVQARNNRPVGFESAEVFGHARIAIEIPSDINTLQRNEPSLAQRWREATRWAFTTSLASGYLIVDFYRSERDSESIGIYVLEHQREISDFE